MRLCFLSFFIQLCDWNCYRLVVIYSGGNERCRGEFEFHPYTRLLTETFKLSMSSIYALHHLICVFSYCFRDGFRYFGSFLAGIFFQIRFKGFSDRLISGAHLKNSKPLKQKCPHCQISLQFHNHRILEFFSCFFFLF